MLKTANVLAGRWGASGVITGDALGQVSSQTQPISRDEVCARQWSFGR